MAAALLVVASAAGSGGAMVVALLMGDESGGVNTSGRHGGVMMVGVEGEPQRQEDPSEGEDQH